MPAVLFTTFQCVMLFCFICVCSDVCTGYSWMGVTFSYSYDVSLVVSFDKHTVLVEFPVKPKLPKITSVYVCFDQNVLHRLGSRCKKFLPATYLLTPPA